MTCWHCQGTLSCDCMLCGHSTQKGWRSGSCEACRGRDWYAKYDHVVQAFDPRDRNNYRRKPAADGSPARLIYTPLEPLR